MISGDDGLGPWSVYKKMNENNIKVSLDGHGPMNYLVVIEMYQQLHQI